MPRTQILVTGAGALASAALFAVAPTAVAGSTLPKVSVRVEGTAKTLLPATVVQPVPGLVKKGGHSCSADSGAGAFNLATKGKWSGTWSSSLKDFEVLKILGDTENYAKTKSYWEVLVNDVPASTGLCGLKLKAGERILLAAIGAKESPALPLGVTVRGTTARVVYYTAKGKPVALAGATVKSGTSRVKTNAAGKATLPAYSKPTTVTATKTGYIRAEATAGA
jgi:hypothetical protein